MFRNYLVAALRNLARNKLYAAINIIGLCVALSSALSIYLYVREEVAFDSWLPEANTTYLLIGGFTQSGRPAVQHATVPPEFAAWMKADFSSIETIARLNSDGASVRHGAVESRQENFYWADSAIFSLLRFPVIAGDLNTALVQPEGIVITRSMARKYFGRDVPLGETLEIERKNPMKVTAVIEDLPSNSNLKIDFIASGKSAFSQLTKFEAEPQCAECYLVSSYTFLKLKPEASILDLEREMPAFFSRHKHENDSGIKYRFSFSPLTALHLHAGLTGINGIGDANALYAISIVGFLIVLIASINFVNLMTARATRRAIEVGIRKVVGAPRWSLIAQFIGESLVYVLIAAVLAVALSELLLPGLSILVDRRIGFAYWRDPALLMKLLSIVLGLGFLAGIYPAFVLSSFRPQTALKGGALQASDSGGIRRVLVVIQFSTLIGLIVAAGVIYRQTIYGLHEGMRLNIDQVLLVDAACSNTFQQEVSILKGVKATSCSGYHALNFGEQNTTFTARDGTKVSISQAPVDFGFFEFYGIRPIAGRLFAKEHVGDAVVADVTAPFQAPFVINEAAAHRLGFANPKEAIGSSTSGQMLRDTVLPSEIIGVVPDFSVDAVHKPVAPTAYYVDKSRLEILSVRLNGRDIPEALHSIDKLWDKLGDPRHPIERLFLEQHVQNLYVDIARQSQLLAICSGIALLIACLGMLGLSAFTAERRTKEIGVRKAMGAGTGEVVRLLVWQFTKPVLWANLIAWPVAAFFMHRWLQGFAYHIDLSPWLFIGATGIALTIALLTVGVHCYLVARAKPVVALRYE